MSLSIRKRMTLGERIRSVRERLGWSGNELAQRVGTTQPTIARIESGETPRPNVFLVAQIAKALGVSIDELIGEVSLKPRPVTVKAKSDDRIAKLEAELEALKQHLQGSPQKPPSKKRGQK